MAKLLIGQTGEGKQSTIDPSSLTKHTIVFGATGSGKTVLCKSIIEEASSRGTPVLAIDPKGDMDAWASALRTSASVPTRTTKRNFSANPLKTTRKNW
jgi:type IV secretory pathway VirB4 component